jgi:hypothetical protein
LKRWEYIGELRMIKEKKNICSLHVTNAESPGSRNTKLVLPYWY